MPVPDKTKFAIKTALSLTLAYMLPMAFGWPQPQTAATTVMLIAATGMVSESLQKGVLRILGTVVGAIIGLTLIALFPQDRMLYLFCVSVVVALLMYLYNAYQGDSTLFMLAAVVIMMVFNGGDAEGAFLFGIDRALLTAFGVMVYTVVGSLLWPVRVQDNTRALATEVSTAHSEAFSLLDSSATAKSGSIEEFLKKNEQFQSHFVSIRNEADAIKAYRGEWDTIANSFEQIDEILVPALQSASLDNRQYQEHILNYREITGHIASMFEEIQGSWHRQVEQQQKTLIELEYNAGSLKKENHLTAAAVVSRADLLLKLQAVLLQLRSAISSLLSDSGKVTAADKFRGKPSFIWLDRENLKTAIRVFTTFWIAIAIWIQFNPPGGFMFVTLSTALVVLVSFTPVAPKMLFILFTIGFMFAVPAYIFLLPQMTHWTELAVLLFSYAFIGFYVFAGPMSIFFLLGLMTLGIQNTMNYNFNVILILILLFYMVCTVLIVAVYFPFTSKPQRLYVDFRQRFFSICAKIITRGATGTRITTATSLTAKMRMWGAMIDNRFFPANPPEKITRFNASCTVLLEQLKILAGQDKVFKDNTLIVRAQKTRSNSKLLSRLCNSLATSANDKDIGDIFDEVDREVGNIESRLGEFLGEGYLDTYDRKDLTEFYLYINLQASILAALVQCRESLEELDWDQLQGQRF